MEKIYDFVVTIELNNESLESADIRVLNIQNDLAEIVEFFLDSRKDIIWWKFSDEFVTYETQDTLAKQERYTIVELNFEIESDNEINNVENFVDLKEGLWNELDKIGFWGKHTFYDNEGGVGLVIRNDYVEFP